MTVLLQIVSSWKFRFIPFFVWLKELKDPQVLKSDIIAGITIAMILVPQSMAYASLAGLPAYYGLYASFLPVMVASVFGSSRQLGTGPVAVVSLLTASALEPLAATNPEGYLVYAVMLALMVGMFQLVLGLFQLGILVDFLSHPVVLGFTNAAAIIIATSQLSKVLGVAVEKADHHYETVWRVLDAGFTDFHTQTVLMAILALAMLFLMKKFFPKSPTVLVAVVVTTLVSWQTGFEASGGKVVGHVPSGLPPFSFPIIDFSVLPEMLAATVTIALIGFMEAISIAKAMAAQSRDRLDPNQELVGQGLANISSALSNSYPVSGSFSRSAVNFTAGARTGFSSVVTGLVVGVTLLFLTPLLYHLPQATLGAVIIMAVITLIKIKPVVHAWKVEKHDGVVAVTTFALTLFFAPHLEEGIIIGVLLSLGLFVFRTMRPRIAEVSMHEDGTLRDAVKFHLPTSEEVAVVRLDMSLYFANAGYLETWILELLADRPKLSYLIIDGEGINTIDASGEGVLGNINRTLKAQGVELLLTRLKTQIIEKFERSGLLQRIGEEHFFRRTAEGIYYATARLEDASSTECLRFSHHICATE